MRSVSMKSKRLMQNRRTHEERQYTKGDKQLSERGSKREMLLKGTFTFNITLGTFILEFIKADPRYVQDEIT